MDEFALIEKYFQPLGKAAPESNAVALGIGDDCALLANRPGYQLAVTADTLVSGVHFLADTHPLDLGYKALAVNLSDLAAMGAEPAWFTLCITLADQDDAWLQAFCQGMAILAHEFAVPLVGGDTTKGPLTISVQVAGWVPENQALRRSSAQVGDAIYVSGDLGWPFLGLQQLQGDQSLQGEAKHQALERLLRPKPQIVLGRQLLGLAHSAIDISDGLTADLNHILSASRVGAQLNLKALPLATPLMIRQPEIQQAAVNFGDEYQLLFTAPERHHTDIVHAASCAGVAVHHIGEITAARQLVDEDNQPIVAQGYRHFS